jgi:hypothetical protein
MRKLYVTLAAAAAVFLVSGPASAQNRELFTAVLNVAQEVPPPVGPNLNGIGVGTLEIVNENSVILNLGAINLSTPIVGAHVHIIPGLGADLAAAGLTGPIRFNLLASQIPNNFYFTTDRTFSATAADLASIRAGNSYFNVHTTQNPAGEIRGNIPAIPEPGTVALMAGAALPLLGLARRRRMP